MSECTHDCSTCGADCASRKPESLLAPQNAMSNVKKVIAVMSGKGGVGKSLVTSLMAVLAQRGGDQAAILDADITGPSIPKMFGIHDKAMGCEDGILPADHLHELFRVPAGARSFVIIHKYGLIPKMPLTEHAQVPQL